MPKDYKDAPASRGSSRPSHPLLLGVIIGLLLGIVISLAVALWLNRLSNPFVQKNRPVGPLPRIGTVPEPPADEAKAPAAAPAQGPAAPGKGDRPRFEFYQILPGEKEATQGPAQAAAPSAPPSSPPAAAPKAPEAPRPGSSPA
ncbi:MAG TPA: hypothetical protein VLY46_14225, partial [Usitatibacter sp.]|nr:hypothetical protein [Usitatibacter sp.]